MKPARRSAVPSQPLSLCCVVGWGLDGALDLHRGLKSWGPAVDCVGCLTHSLLGENSVGRTVGGGWWLELGESGGSTGCLDSNPADLNSHGGHGLKGGGGPLIKQVMSALG